MTAPMIVASMEKSFAENGHKEYKMASMSKTDINMSAVSPITVQ